MRDLFETQRRTMVDSSIAGRGVTDPRVLKAMNEVPRHLFLPEQLREFAYDDTPLPIEHGQTISQPYIVALMAQALQLKATDRVLEVGTGSGYAAAVLACLAGDVHTIERHQPLAQSAEQVLHALGYTRVKVHHGDGTQGWAAAAPFDAIIVAAGAPSIPEPLLAQLADGGRLVIPVGDEVTQGLIRVRRAGDQFLREDLGDVRFVPLIGANGWNDPGHAVHALPSRQAGVAALLSEVAEPVDDIESVDLSPLLDRIGDARVVLLGEATHGTSEFYRMRERITRELILRRGFNVVAVEADWPDAAQLDRYARQLPPSEYRFTPFERFPTWLWRNHETLHWVEWLRAFNTEHQGDPERQVMFSGLDLYSLYTSASAVIAYLEKVDPMAAADARNRYGCLTPWQFDPAAYGRAATTGRYAACEEQAVRMLRDLLQRRLDYAAKDGDRFFDAAQNARLVVDAERYYRVMYWGSRQSWNLRDQHMFDTLEAILTERGPKARAVIWAHNSHVGDARATEMGRRGEHNIGQLCHLRFADGAYRVGFGTDHGTVAAATEWDGPMEIKKVRPAHALSYERLCHDSQRPAFLMALRDPVREAVREELMPTRLERAIGVIYRPESERQSHYFEAQLPAQFDEYIWFDETVAVQPLRGRKTADLAHHPFGAI
jgi:protein-L-isoaspartate(D-aspartate) O-methyltransferase